MKEGVILILFLTTYLVKAADIPPWGTGEKLVLDSIQSTIKNDDAKLLRPVKDLKEAINVTIGTTLLKVRRNPLYSNDMEALIFASVMWTDYRFTWDPTDCDGVTKIHIPAEMIWKPDLRMFRSNLPFKGDKETLAIIYNTGTVVYVPAIYMPFLCVSKPMQKGKSLNCSQAVGSWTYDNSQIKLQVTPVDDSSVLESSEWSLDSFTAEKRINKYDCCPEEFPRVQYNMIVTSKSKSKKPNRRPGSRQ